MLARPASDPLAAGRENHHGPDVLELSEMGNGCQGLRFNSVRQGVLNSSERGVTGLTAPPWPTSHRVTGSSRPRRVVKSWRVGGGLREGQILTD